MHAAEWMHREAYQPTLMSRPRYSRVSSGEARFGADGSGGAPAPPLLAGDSSPDPGEGVGAKSGDTSLLTALVACGPVDLP